MKRYIDADALKERMLNYYDCLNEDTCKSNYRGETLMNYEVADMIEDCIENAPAADVVEVVRCRDCKHCEQVESLTHIWSCFCNRFRNTMEVDAEDYCSYGERREENEG